MAHPSIQRPAPGFTNRFRARGLTATAPGAAMMGLCWLSLAVALGAPASPAQAGVAIGGRQSSGPRANAPVDLADPASVEGHGSRAVPDATGPDAAVGAGMEPPALIARAPREPGPRSSPTSLDAQRRLLPLTGTTAPAAQKHGSTPNASGAAPGRADPGRGDTPGPSTDGHAGRTGPHDRLGPGESSSSLTKWLGGDQLLQTLIPISILGLLAVAVRAILLRGPGGAPRPNGVTEVLARYPVGRGQQVVLLRVGRRVIVAHQADRSMRTLCEMADPDEVAELIEKCREGSRDSFARLLARRSAQVDPFEDAELVDLTSRRWALRRPERGR